MCWCTTWKIWGMMRMFLMILMFITMMIKRIWIASDQIVLWIHSQWYNALKHLQNKMVDMIKMGVMLSTFPSKFFVATKLFLSSTKSIVFLRANIAATSGGNCHEDPAVARSVIGEKTGRAVRNETRSGISCSLCLWNPGKDSSWIFEEKSSQRERFPSIERDLLVESESETAGEERVNIGEDPQGTQGQCERYPAGVLRRSVRSSFQSSGIIFSPSFSAICANFLCYSSKQHLT